jgi:membrane associated rhomboid family serine protease
LCVSKTERLKILGEHIPYEKRRFIHSLIIPLLFLLTCWLVHLWQVVLDVSFTDFGILPRTIKGLWGILFMPFLHGSTGHLLANSGTFLLLGIALFYFYREVAYKVFVLLFFTANIFLWIAGRQYWHVGASGLIYGLGAFLFVSGIIRRHVNLTAISFIVVFLYGGMFWYMFPLPVDEPISWEGHLTGAIAGVLYALMFRGYGPQKTEWVWEEESEDSTIDETDIMDNDLKDKQNNDTPN